MKVEHHGVIICIYLHRRQELTHIKVLEASEPVWSCVHYPECQPANGVRPSNYCLSVCLTTVSSTLLLCAFLSLPWHGWPLVHTWDDGRGSVSEMPLSLPDTPVAFCQVALLPHVRPTTYCVDTNWRDLLDVMIRHLYFFNKICSAQTPGLH